MQSVVARSAEALGTSANIKKSKYRVGKHDGFHAIAHETKADKGLINLPPEQTLPPESTHLQDQSFVCSRGYWLLTSSTADIIVAVGSTACAVQKARKSWTQDRNTPAVWSDVREKTRTHAVKKERSSQEPPNINSNQRRSPSPGLSKKLHKQRYHAPENCGESFPMTGIPYKIQWHM